MIHYPNQSIDVIYFSIDMILFLGRRGHTGVCPQGCPVGMLDHAETDAGEERQLEAPDLPCGREDQRSLCPVELYV